jgi:hypothetical protein
MRVVGVVLSCMGASLLLGGCAESTSPGVVLAGDGGAIETDSGTLTPASTNGDASNGSPLDSGTTNPPGGDGSSSTDGRALGDSSSSRRDTGSPSSSDAGAGSSGDGATGPVPTIGGCTIFPADNPWNTRVDDPVAFPVHPQSATYVASMSPSTHLHADWGDWSSSKYGIPWQTVPAGTPGVPMTFQYASESDPGPYPFPANARVEGGAGSGGDMHVLVIDTGTCTLYETWSSTFNNPGWSCGSGAKFDLSSNALRPDGWTSSDAAGLPVLPGLVRVSEVTAGVINHALRFTVSSTQQAYIHPATHAAGSSNASLPPMGLRVRLKASFDLSAYSGPAKVILTAMKQYGLLLADNGSNWYITGDSDDGWSPLMSGIAQAFNGVHGSDFEAVDTGPLH